MSLFSFYRAPATAVNYYKEASLYDVYRCLIDPRVAGDPTSLLRTLTDKQQRALLKRKMFNYCTFSGSFGPNRRDNAIRSHSRLLCIDFDHLLHPDLTRTQLLQDEQFETLLLFRSPSGDGIKWVIPIGAEDSSLPIPEGKPASVEVLKDIHAQWFEAVCAYLRATYGLSPDPACRNLARACFIPYDPEAYIAPRLIPNSIDNHGQV